MRQDPGRARRMFERRIPNEGQRTAYLTILANVIERLHALNPRAWSVSLFPGSFKLNVGRVMALDMRKRGLRLYLVEDLIEPVELERLKSKGVVAREFLTLPEVIGFRLQVADFLDAHARNAKAYGAYLELAAGTARKCPWADAYSPAVLEYLEQELDRELPRPEFDREDLGSGVSAEDLEPLFEEFLETYWVEDLGRRHAQAYAQQRATAREHWNKILELDAAGKDVTEAVLLGVLPHRSSPTTRERGAWINIAPAVTRDIREWFEGAGWTETEDWPHIARAILRFLRTSLETPARLAEACREFSEDPLSKGFQSALLSPFLNAIDPAHFATVNSKPLKVLNHFWGQDFTSKIAEYAEVNAFLAERVLELSQMLQCEETEGHLPGDVFDQFCHYLVAEREEWPPRSDAEDDDADGGASRVSESSSSEPAFSKRAFELLAALHEEPTKATYSQHKDDLKAEVEEPLRAVLAEIAAEFTPEMRELLETESGLISRFPKNDYGRGGAWDYLWGAFFPEGGKRTGSPQLYLTVGGLGVDFGFGIGTNGKARGSPFFDAVAEHGARLASYLDWALRGLEFRYGDGPTPTGEEDPRVGPDSPHDPKSWLAVADQVGVRLLHRLPTEQVLAMSRDDLVELGARIHIALFPLMLAAVGGDLDAFLDRWEAEPSTPSTSADASTTLQPVLTVQQCSDRSGFEVAEIERWLRAIRRKRQAILYGPPGTGKTFLAELLARHLVGGGDGRVELVQFHPSYGYEDFMQGIRPQTRSDRSLAYDMVPGRFLVFCDQAARRKGTSVLIVDEINRANLSRVFGELMYLLEYRDREIPLAGGGRFKVPDNVVLLGTMNTADRSIALVDNALRRRFAFLPLYPRMDVLRTYHVRNGFRADGLISVLERINRRIADPNYSLGISFFLHEGLREQISDIWQMEIVPYLEEHFFDQRSTVDDFRWELVRDTILA
jgi:hypothetical protein